jgi:hypothetical protein
MGIVSSIFWASSSRGAHANPTVASVLVLEFQEGLCTEDRGAYAPHPAISFVIRVGEVQVMSIPVLVLFLVFFLAVGPVFLYWFSRYSKDLLSKRSSFIGFPEDGRSDRDQSRER